MTALLEILLAPPTVIYTIPMGLVVLYWLTVMVGAADIDLFDGGLDGAVEGLDGGLDGAVEGAVDGVLEGAADVEGAVDAATDAMDGIEAEGNVPGLGVLRWLAFILRIGKVPVTITATMLLMSGWTVSFLLAWQLGGRIDLPPGAMSAGIVAASTLVGTVFTNVMSRPLEPIFQVTQARSRLSLVGELCEVSTGRVDGRFGQATAMLDGDDLLFQIRCDTTENGLARGNQALIVSYDDDREAFVVEPLASPAGVSSSHKTAETNKSAAQMASQSERSTEV